MIDDETIVAEHFYIRFLRTARDGVVEVVDRHHADTVEVTRRNPDGTDGERTTFPVKRIVTPPPSSLPVREVGEAAISDRVTLSGELRCPYPARSQPSPAA